MIKRSGKAALCAVAALLLARGVTFAQSSDTPANDSYADDTYLEDFGSNGQLDNGLMSSHDLLDHGYVRISGGATFLPNSRVKSFRGMDLSSFDGEFNFNTAGLGSVAVGLYHDPFRFEGEFTGIGGKIDSLQIGSSKVPGISGHFRSLSLMGNLLVDLNLNERVGVYFGGGIGAAFLHAKFNGFTAGGITVGDASDDDAVFAWQVKTGVQVQVTRGIFVTLGYRLFSFTDPEFSGVSIKAPLTSSVEVGVRFTF